MSPTWQELWYMVRGIPYVLIGIFARTFRFQRLHTWAMYRLIDLSEDQASRWDG